jgi:hypothetical protein
LSRPHDGVRKNQKIETALPLGGVFVRAGGFAMVNGR